jgi:hypothetical protein
MLSELLALINFSNKFMIHWKYVPENVHDLPIAVKMAAYPLWVTFFSFRIEAGRKIGRKDLLM